ncbi:MAG: EI24 domain-containing protein [Micrococcales bacterium]|nr:EI24 domain-containing protein [Micrococcales bacterium]MCL2667114.1 EI24 domain-containing protein [Micrococcales bacterium]
MSAPQPGTFFTEVGGGLAALRRGFSLWRHSPRLMLLGAAPALVVGTVFLAVFVVVMVATPALVDWATPFADGWPSLVRGAARIALWAAVVLLVGWALTSWYAATTLFVGEPFFDKIAEQVERLLGNPPPPAQGPGTGLAIQASTSLRMAVQGVALSVCLFFIGLIPVVGTVAAFVVAVVVGGRLLSNGLTSRALEARGFSQPERRHLVKARRVRASTFGSVAYLLFLVPVVSIAAMPAVVAGATVLARDLLPDRTLQPPADSEYAPASGTIVAPGGFA